MGHLAPGRAIAGLAGRYTIERRLSRGSARAVFFARDERGRALVATELHASEITDWSDVERTIAEAELQRDVAHPRISSVVDLFATDGDTARAPAELTEAFVPTEARDPATPARLPSLVLVRRFVEGESIEDAIARKRPFSPEGIERVLRSLLEIAKHLHAMLPPVVCLDLEPDTVVVDTLGDAHLVRLVTERGRALAREPERAASAPIASDLRAVGAIALSLLSHRSPDEWPRDASTNRIRIEELAPGLPPRLALVLTRLLSKDAASFSSASDVLAALDARLAKTDPKARRKTRAVMIALTIVASLVLHLAILVVGYRMGHRRPTIPYAIPSYVAERPVAPAVQPSQITPSLPPPPPTILEWTGTVKHATPTLAEGTPCAMNVEVKPPEVCTIALACGTEIVADHVDAPCRVTETITSSGAVYELSVGGRVDGANPIYVHGTDAIVFPSRLHDATVAVKLDKTSVATATRLDGLGTPTRFTEPVVWNGIAVGVQNVAGLAKGTPCTMTVDPVISDEANCRATVRCGEHTLYRGHPTRCGEAAPIDFSDLETSAIDGDPRVEWPDGHILHVTDVTARGPMAVEIYLEREKPGRDGGE